MVIYVQVGFTHSFNDTAKCFEVLTRCLSQEQRAWCSSLCQRPSTCSLRLGHLYSPTRPEPRHGIATGRQKNKIATGRQYSCSEVDAAHTPRRIGTPICSVATFVSTVECQDIASHSTCKFMAPLVRFLFLQEPAPGLQIDITSTSSGEKNTLFVYLVSPFSSCGFRAFSNTHTGQMLLFDFKASYLYPALCFLPYSRRTLLSCDRRSLSSIGTNHLEKP